MGWHLLALVLSAISIVRGNIAVIDLGGSHWTVTSENKSISTEATVPGGIYSDLRRGNILKEDVYYRDNDLKYRWVSKTGWTYSTEFEVTDKNFLALPNQFLVFHGVDTIATIYLNDKELGKTDNMFVRYRVDVKDKLQAKNKLSIVIGSPIVEADRISKSLEHPVPPDCTPGSYNGECHINMLRKMQASFAWDWGPAMPSVGIWKSVELEGYHVARIRDILTDITYHEDLKSWHLSVRVILEAGLSQAVVKAKLTAELAVGKKPLRVDSLVNAEPGHGEIEVVSTLMVPASEVELWWPNGYGEQPLYNLQITLASGVEMSTKSIKIGFRTVELIQDHVDPNHLEKGRYFYFEVNKVPIYSKGSNLIPVDILPERSNNESTIRDLLVSTKEANMNMLRVWGGGVYMSDYFYETCDELGILIWQDMMFACNNYPATPTFLQSVRSEISQTVRRIQHHPCIAVWAGNNEMEGATIQKWYIRENPELYYKEYAELYVNTLKPIVLQYDPTRPYLTSSPTNGIESEKAKYALADNPYSNIYGDTHNYDYYQNLWDPSTAPKSRFCSEFGIQSLPQLSTFQKVATEADLASWRTPFFDSRQHLAGGTGILESSVGHQFEIGNLTLEYFAYLSQIYQAGAIKTITEQMRRDKGVLREDGSGHNMGALYWQLNDVWQAPTWSSIDYDGNWKMLHYFARKFFAPVLISPVLNVSSRTLEVVLLNDPNRPLHNVTIVTESYAWNDTRPFRSVKTPLVTVESNSVHKVLTKPLSELLPHSAHHHIAAYYIKVSAVETTPPSGPAPLMEPNYLYLAPLKNSTKYMKDPEIKIRHVVSKKLASGQTEFTITLCSQHISLFTWLSIDEVRGKYSDNGFNMMGDHEVRFVTDNSSVTVDYVLNHMTVMNVQFDPAHQKPTKPEQSSSAATLPSMQWSLVLGVLLTLL
ncbi:hypothetical protein M8J77_013520 [Diaphorina citri]|nr:hypothetical protein M8J77_013520 [Diaphorina citri]